MYSSVFQKVILGLSLVLPSISIVALCKVIAEIGATQQILITTQQALIELQLNMNQLDSTPKEFILEKTRVEVEKIVLPTIFTVSITLLSYVLNLEEDITDSNLEELYTLTLFLLGGSILYLVGIESTHWGDSLNLPEDQNNLISDNLKPGSETTKDSNDPVVAKRSLISACRAYWASFAKFIGIR